MTSVVDLFNLKTSPSVACIIFRFRMKRMHGAGDLQKQKNERITFSDRWPEWSGLACNAGSRWQRHVTCRLWPQCRLQSFHRLSWTDSATGWLAARTVTCNRNDLASNCASFRHSIAPHLSATHDGLQDGPKSKPLPNKKYAELLQKH